MSVIVACWIIYFRVQPSEKHDVIRLVLHGRHYAGASKSELAFLVRAFTTLAKSSPHALYKQIEAYLGNQTPHEPDYEKRNELAMRHEDVMVLNQLKFRASTWMPVNDKVGTPWIVKSGKFELMPYPTMTQFLGNMMPFTDAKAEFVFLEGSPRTGSKGKTHHG